MKLVLALILVAWLQSTHGLIFDWHNALPWAKDMPERDYKNNIELRLVKKDWQPKGPNIPSGDELIPQYSGKVADAYEMFRDKTIMYEYHSRPLERATELLTTEFGYDPNLPSIVVLHTISGDAQNSFVKNIMTVLALRNFVKTYNIFAFNMPGLQASMEQTIIKSIFGRKANFYALGDTMGGFFDSAIQLNLMRPDQINLLGFCYSSQLAGYIGRHIHKVNKQKIKSILGLDPYSIGFSGVRNKILTADDAEVVHAYHTNSMAFGTLYRKATADFSFNSGFSQPGCYTSGVGNVQCSHRRSVTAMWYIILYPDLFLARSCRSWINFKFCLCNRKATVPLTFPPSPGPRGIYYLNTMSHRPYGFGPAGANCYTKHDKSKTTKSKESSKKEKDVDFTRSRTF